MKNRNILRCGECGTEILTDAVSRQCYKCDNDMELVGKEREQNV